MSSKLGAFRNYLLSACLVSFSVIPLALQCSAETPKSETKSDTAATTPAATVPSSSAKGDSGSSASIDNFIPGSEVMPVAQAPSDDFINKQKPTMDLALLLHKNREYKQALIVLNKLPPTEQSRYYTGLCYKSLGNTREATAQFAWLAYYAKDQRLKGYAFAAIRAMKPLKPTKRDPGGSTSTIYSSQQAKIRSQEITARIQGENRARAAKE